VIQVLIAPHQEQSGPSANQALARRDRRSLPSASHRATCRRASKGKRVVALDLGSLVAGTNSAGEVRGPG